MTNAPTSVAVSITPRDAAKLQDDARQQFQEQIDFFRKKLNLPTDRWDDIWQGAHDRAFIVAGAQKADLLNDLRAAVDKANQGGSIGEFRKAFAAAVKNSGWSGWTGSGTTAGVAWRTRVIYQTNIATSYAAGRWQQLNDPELLKVRPYWRYIHNDSVISPRPQHKAWGDAGLTLRHDHPFWLTHFPPNGWGCMCSVQAVRGPKAGDATEPPVGWDTVQDKTHAPPGIDKGWAYAPGAGASASLQDLVSAKLIKLDAPIGAAMWELLKPALDLEVRTTAFAEWANAIRTSGKTTGDFSVVGAIGSKTLSKLQDLGVVPATAEIVVRDQDVWHTFRDTKASALPWDWYVNLPTHMGTPIAVILDRSQPGTPALLYVFDLPDNATGRLVLKLDYTVVEKGADGIKRKKPMNVLRTGSVVDVGDLKNPAMYELLSGEL